MDNLIHWFLHITGVDNVSGSYYGFWSGFGSDLGEAAILGGVYTFIRKHNCHVKGCWKIGHFKVDGTPFITCKIHHPELIGRITCDHIWNKYKRGDT